LIESGPPSYVTIKVAVRALVSFVLRSGDLRSDYIGALSALEGIRAQQGVQRQRPAGYQSEVAVRHDVAQPDFNLSIGGRIDGVMQRGGHVVVEEIKATRRPLDEVRASPSTLHWGQAQCYAYMYAVQEGLSAVDVQLTYVHADTGKVLEMVRHQSLEVLSAFFDDLLGRYLPWVRRLSQWAAIRDQSLEALGFPFESYRAGQREMAVAVFRTIRDNGQLLVQAATGIGKTMAALYPALKALGQGHADKVVFLTARTTGRLAAEAALHALGDRGMRLKWVSLTAKEKICFTPGQACGPETCDYARGHFDRLNDALAAAFEYDALTRDTIETVSRDHRVCPFELSLELLDWAECVIGDYNYAFDPHVTLRRLFGEEDHQHAVLVDEAHNLVDRSRDMFSAQLSKAPVLALRRRLKAAVPRVYRALGRINSWMAAYRRGCLAAGAGGVMIETGVPQGLPERLRVFMACADHWLRANAPSDFREDLLRFYFDCLHFLRVAERYGPEYATICQADEKAALRIKLFCMDPSEQLRQCWQRCRGAVLFSATLTPAGYFQSILGCTAQTAALNLASPFPSANLAVFVTPRISTFYRRRQDSCRAVSRAIANLVFSRSNGNYLLFFPSYEYMAMVHQCFCREHPQCETMVQTADMTDAQRLSFLAAFTPEATRTLIGFAVMGGIFGEGIDLKGDRLTAAVIVGVGLPGNTPERELIRAYYDRTCNSGFAFAYQFPGLNRVLQAAGRVIRSESDRGVVLLIDQRFMRHDYRMLLPASWRMHVVDGETGFQNQLTAFWQDAGDAQRQ
jgi:DNA excision repair protein ERCC-2